MKVSRPKRHVKTRWNSAVIMLISFQNYQHVITATVRQCPELYLYKLSPYHWEVMDELIRMLEVSLQCKHCVPADPDCQLQGFLYATQTVSRSEVPLIHEMIPIMDTLFEGLKTAAEECKLDCLRHAAARGMKVLNKYYTLVDASHAAVIATCLSSEPAYMVSGLSHSNCLLIS